MNILVKSSNGITQVSADSKLLSQRKVFVEGEPPGGERSGKAEEQPECRWPPDRMPATQVQRTEKRFLAGGKIGPVHRELLSSGF